MSAPRSCVDHVAGDLARCPRPDARGTALAIARALLAHGASVAADSLPGDLGGVRLMTTRVTVDVDAGGRAVSREVSRGQ